MKLTLTMEDLQIPAIFKRELSKLRAAAKRRWKAIPHETRYCIGGPFAGQLLACSCSDATTLTFTVVAGGTEWHGRYTNWCWTDVDRGASAVFDPV